MKIINRSSDGAIIVVHTSAEKIIVRTVEGERVIDAYQLTPERSAAFREALESAELQAKEHRRRRKQEESSGLVQTSFA